MQAKYKILETTIDSKAGQIYQPGQIVIFEKFEKPGKNVEWLEDLPDEKPAKK